MSARIPFPASPENGDYYTDDSDIRWQYNTFKKRWSLAPLPALSQAFISSLTTPGADSQHLLWIDPSDGTQSYWDAAADAWVVTSGAGTDGEDGEEETTATIITKLSGSDGRIGAAVLPETITPTTLVLPDFGATTPPLNALGLSGGRIAKGDGVTVAGVPLTPRRVAGSLVLDLTGTNKTSARFAVVGIPMTAAEMVNGSNLQISGTVKLIFDDNFYAGEEPLISATIGFTHNAYKIDVTTKWVKYNCLPTGTEFAFAISMDVAGNFQIITNATPGVGKVVITNNGSLVVSDRWAGAAGNTFIRNNASIVFVDATDTSVAVDESTADTIWLCVELVTGASGTNGTVLCSVLYDLDTAVTLP